MPRRYVPDDIFVLLAAIPKPPEALLRALVHLVRTASEPGLSQWYLATILLPAAGAVYNVRHGAKAHPRAVPLALEGALAELADEITATVAKVLSKAQAVDALHFQSHHDAAWADAEHSWVHRWTQGEREELIAEHAQLSAHEGLLHAMHVDGTYGALERQAVAKVQKEMLLRRHGYDDEAEEEHELLLYYTLRAVGNLGSSPAHVGGEALLLNASTCLSHRSEIVRSAAATALRRSPHPAAESALRAQLDRPHTSEHWNQRRAALQALANWEHVSPATIERAVDELIAFPLRTHKECHEACGATRNPHLVHNGVHKGFCEKACTNERQHIEALHKLLKKHDDAGVHDLPRLIQARVEAAVEALEHAERMEQEASTASHSEESEATEEDGGASAAWAANRSFAATHHHPARALTHYVAHTGSNQGFQCETEALQTRSPALPPMSCIVLQAKETTNSGTYCPAGTCTTTLSAAHATTMPDGSDGGVHGCSGQRYSQATVTGHNLYAPGQAGSASEVCEVCVVGKYQHMPGATACVDCANDQTCNVAGMSTNPGSASANDAGASTTVATGWLVAGAATWGLKEFGLGMAGAPAGTSKAQLAKNAAKKVGLGVLKQAAGQAAMNICASVSDCDNIEGNLLGAINPADVLQDTSASVTAGVGNLHQGRRLEEAADPVSGRRLAGKKMSKQTCKTIQNMCIGIDIALGHTPIVKGAKYAGPKLPIVGECGLEWSLVIANSMWAKLGMFDGGFGIDVEDTFTLEWYVGVTRVEIFKIGIELKFDFTYCNVCEISRAERFADGGTKMEALGISRRRLSEVTTVSSENDDSSVQMVGGSASAAELRQRSRRLRALTSARATASRSLSADSATPCSPALTGTAASTCKVTGLLGPPTDPSAMPTLWKSLSDYFKARDALDLPTLITQLGASNAEMTTPSMSVQVSVRLPDALRVLPSAPPPLLARLRSASLLSILWVALRAAGRRLCVCVCSTPCVSS